MLIFSQSERTVIQGPAMGGNKLRKLEYIVPDILASGADTLVSIGGVQSKPRGLSPPLRLS